MNHSCIKNNLDLHFESSLNMDESQATMPTDTNTKNREVLGG